jgi:hypothetical protein
MHMELPSDITSTSRLPIVRNWFDRGLLLATLLTCAVAISPAAADPDLWGHVQYGRDALTDGLSPTTTYSFTAEGYRWINHENLAELFLATMIDTVGPVGLLIVKCLLGVGVIGLIMFVACRQGASLLSVCLLAMLVSTNLTYFWSTRPQLLSYIYCALLMGLLAYCFKGWQGRCHFPWLEPSDSEAPPLIYSSFRMRCLWLAPVLFFFWANSHGGFVAGYCIFVAYIGLRGLELLINWGRGSYGMLRRLTMMVVASGLATLINPYGPGLHEWLIQSLTRPRPEIIEWHAPDMTSTVMIPLWVIMFSWFAVMLLTRRSRDITHFVILLLTLWQTLSHVRHMPFFAIPFGFWMAPHIDSVLQRFRIGEHTDSLGQAMKPAMKFALVSVFLFAFLLLGYKLNSRLRQMTVDRKEYPVAAMQFMADNEMHGRLIVTYNWAQYTIAAFGPAHPDDKKAMLVSFDGRFRTCYPQEVVDMNFDFVLGDLVPRYRGSDPLAFDDEEVLEYGDPDVVLINRLQPHSVNVMFRNLESWTLLYQDGLAQVWGRSKTFDDSTSSRYIAPDRRQVTDDEQVGKVSWPALPQRQRTTGQLGLVGAL